MKTKDGINADLLILNGIQYFVTFVLCIIYALLGGACVFFIYRSIQIQQAGVGSAADYLSLAFNIIPAILTFGGLCLLVSATAFIMKHLFKPILIRWGSYAPHYKQHKLKKLSQADYYRGIPFQGNLRALCAACKMTKDYCNYQNILGFYILKWIRTSQVSLCGSLQPGAAMLADENIPSMKFKKLRNMPDRREKELYTMLYQASGKDRVMKPDELQNWLNTGKNAKRVERWYDEFICAGIKDLLAMGAIKEVPLSTIKARAFKSYYEDGGLPTKTVEVQPLGYDLMEQAQGFMHFLDDFTLIGERNAYEVQLWKNYLIYAHLFKRADKVEENFEDLYPECYMHPSSQFEVHSHMMVHIFPTYIDYYEPFAKRMTVH